MRWWCLGMLDEASGRGGSDKVNERDIKGEGGESPQAERGRVWIVG